MSFHAIPEELRRIPQWINWKWENKTKIPLRSRDGCKASVSDPRDWSSFEFAVSICERMNAIGLGFVFTKGDPFTGIDFDDPEGDLHTYERQKQLVATLNSYTELSPSGRGVHVIVEANLPGPGRRKGKFECYDNLRFFCFTGNVLFANSIANRQTEVIDFYNTLGAKIEETNFDAFQHETYSDEQVIQHAGNAVNGEKFRRLFGGDWQTDYGQQSQSEADFALINIIAFYSKNATQTIRIFRSSALGSRQKSQRGDYVSRMVRRSFDKMPAQVRIAVEPGQAWFNAAAVEPWRPKAASQPYEPVLYTPLAAMPSRPPPSPATASEFPEPKPPMVIPGLVGKLVEHCWTGASHQIAEVAIASALSTMSALCARTYRTGTMGLTMYLLILAQTSTGKSFGFAANDEWFNALLNHYNSFPPPYSQPGKKRADALREMMVTKFASVQGLMYAFQKSPSLLLHGDEYLDDIKLMAKTNCPPNLEMIKSELLRLTEMSGPGRVYRPARYSAASKSNEIFKDIVAASLTVLATGTPEGFYDDLSYNMLTSGFLPRFTIMEYNGELPRKNRNIRTEINPEVINSLMLFYDRAYNMQVNIDGLLNKAIDVQPKDQAAIDAMEQYENHCFRNIRHANANSEPMAGLWSRAKDNVLKIACLIAIGVDPNEPRYEADHIRIGIQIVQPTLDKIAGKIRSGDTGSGDDKQEAEIRRIIMAIYTKGPDAARTNPSLNQTLLANGFIQLGLVRNRAMKLKVFRNHRMGGIKAFDDTIRAMCNYNIIRVVEANGTKCIVPDFAAFTLSDG